MFSAKAPRADEMTLCAPIASNIPSGSRRLQESPRALRRPIAVGEIRQTIENIGELANFSAKRQRAAGSERELFVFDGRPSP